MRCRVCRKPVPESVQGTIVARLCPACARNKTAMRPEQLARLSQETFEKLASELGYKRRPETMIFWRDISDADANKRMMIAVADVILRAQELLFCMNETGGRGADGFNCLSDIWYRQGLPPFGYNEDRGCYEIYPPISATTAPPESSQETNITDITAHYVAYNGRHLTALIIGREGNLADLAVFTNMGNVAGKKNYGMQFHQDAEYSAEPTPGTWHWIERS